MTDRELEELANEGSRERVKVRASADRLTLQTTCHMPPPTAEPLTLTRVTSDLAQGGRWMGGRDDVGDNVANRYGRC